MAESFPNMYNYLTDSGMIIPSTDNLKQSWENLFKGIYGDKLDVTPETPVGRIIESLTVLSKTTIGVNAQNANQINLNSSIGAYLDGIGSLFNVHRLPPTKTRVNISVSFRLPSDSTNAIIPEGTMLATKDGNLFRIVSDIEIEGEPDSTVTTDGIAESVSDGPVACPEGDLIQIIDDVEGFVSVTNVGGAIYGRLTESDYSYRNRISQSRGMFAGSVGSITNAIWEAVPELSGVIVLENGYGDVVVKNGISMKPHSIFVCVAGGFDDNINKEIAKAIWQTKTIGAAYTDDAPNEISKITVSIDNDDFDSIPVGHSYDVVFYKAETIDVDINIKVNPSKYTGINIRQDITTALANFIANKQMGDELTRFEIGSAITNAIPTLFVYDVSLSVNGTSYDKISPSAMSILTLGSLEITLLS